MGPKINARNLLALVILLLAGVLAVTVLRNYRGSGPEEAVKALPRNVDFSLKEFSYNETRDGERRWTLAADKAEHSLSEGVARIENVRMTFFDDQGAEEATLTARHGLFRVEAREVEVDGDVVLKSPRGYTLYTDRLAYREADRVIRTAAPVRMLSERAELRGRGLNLDLQKRTLTLLSDVEARIEGTGASGTGRKKG